MRKEFGRVLRRIFTDQLAKHDKSFAVDKVGSPYLFPGERAYSKSIEGQKTKLFVVLVPDAKREAFMLEIGWSSLGRFPELQVRPSGWPTPERNEFQHPEFICRLSELFDRSHNQWFIQPAIDPFSIHSTDDFLNFVKRSMKPISPEQALLLAKPPVDDAIDKLVKFGIPYLNEYEAAVRANGFNTNTYH